MKCTRPLARLAACGSVHVAACGTRSRFRCEILGAISDALIAGFVMPSRDLVLFAEMQSNVQFPLFTEYSLQLPPATTAALGLAIAAEANVTFMASLPADGEAQALDFLFVFFHPSNSSALAYLANAGARFV